MREWCTQAVMGEPVEHLLAMLPDGTVWHSVGDAESVSLGDLDYNGAIVVHNHPEGPDGFESFGSDDFKVLQAFPHMAELWAMTDKYAHYVKPNESIVNASYNEAWIAALDRSERAEDNQHYAMVWLEEHGYVDYWRENL